MPASHQSVYEIEAAPRSPRQRRDQGKPVRLHGLSALGSVDIETELLANLSSDLHMLFDAVSEDVLPIYFGPLLGRLYLEGL